jgi:DNA-binding response OmpR family regulator
MARLTYENAKTLVYDPISANRNATRTALYTLGFRHIEAAGTIDAFAEGLIYETPDLAICEAHGVDTELCALIQRLRQGETGENPFVVIIVTAWDNSNSLVGRVVNSGADDLLLRPFSISLLGSRIRTHVERRKGFVVTSDYIGPDRRRDSNRPSDVELFQPPNSLKMKAQDGLTADAVAKRLETELAAARGKFDAEKLCRDAFQICVLWRLLQSAMPTSPNYAADLAKLRTLTQSVWRRSRDTTFAPAIRWCESILSAIEGLEAGVDRNASLHLMGNATLNLHLVFDPETTNADRLSQIDATVAIIHARNQMDLAG